MAESWGLPSELAEVIAAHDQATTASPVLVLLTGLAGQMADAFAADGTFKAFHPPKALLDKLEVSLQAVQGAFDQAIAEVG